MQGAHRRLCRPPIASEQSAGSFVPWSALVDEAIGSIVQFLAFVMKTMFRSAAQRTPQRESLRLGIGIREREPPQAAGVLGVTRQAAHFCSGTKKKALTLGSQRNGHRVTALM